MVRGYRDWKDSLQDSGSTFVFKVGLAGGKKISFYYVAIQINATSAELQDCSSACSASRLSLMDSKSL